MARVSRPETKISCKKQDRDLNILVWKTLALISKEVLSTQIFNLQILRCKVTNSVAGANWQAKLVENWKQNEKKSRCPKAKNAEVKV